METLLPCPFCGEEGKVWPPEYSDYNPSEVVAPSFVNCPGCSVVMPGGMDESEAVQNWNFRTSLRVMAPDAIAEKALIEISRLQRETLERWVSVLALADQHDTADELRDELTRRDEAPNMGIAA